MTAATPEAQDTETPSDTASPTESESSAPADTFTNDKCKGNQSSANAFYVGGILPLTGNLAFLGPPEIAGVGLAVSDINAAGGVNGAKACHNIQDSGDSTDMSVSLRLRPDPGRRQAVGRHRRGLVVVSLNVVDTFADNKITEVSPANTAVDLSGYSPLLLPDRSRRTPSRATRSAR